MSGHVPEKAVWLSWRMSQSQGIAACSALPQSESESAAPTAKTVKATSPPRFGTILRTARVGAGSGTCASRGRATSRATRDRPRKRRRFSAPNGSSSGRTDNRIRSCTRPYWRWIVKCGGRGQRRIFTAEAAENTRKGKPEGTGAVRLSGIGVSVASVRVVAAGGTASLRSFPHRSGPVLSHFALPRRTKFRRIGAASRSSPRAK